MNNLVAAQRLTNTASFLLTFVDGKFIPELSDTPKDITDLILINSTAANNTYNSKIIAFTERRLENEGYFINIPAGINIETPIHILCLATKNATNNNFNYSNLIIAEENCKATIVTEYYSEAELNNNTDVFSQIIIRPNADINLYKIQNESLFASHNCSYEIQLAAQSKLTTYYFSPGSTTYNDNIAVNLHEAGASYKALGIINLQNSQVGNYQTQITHSAPECSSNVLFKGLIDNQASGNFSGRVIVNKNAIKTTTHLTNKNLLLSSQATMNTAPELEIYTDDVICTHGATVGELDQQALFYLRSRGLMEDAAKKILLIAFTQEITDQFASYIQPKIANQGNVHE